MEDGRIANSQITASSEYQDNTTTYHGAHNARLNRPAQTVDNLWTVGAWCAGNANLNSWIQVEFTKPTWVTGVLIQGREDRDQWVTKYKVEYSSEEENWVFVQRSDNQDAVSKTILQERHPILSNFAPR